jgi:(p)ppGpp synthase/HD superfamily hydrolase
LVIVIKLADRLHNMRTVYALSPEKQAAVAAETRAVWCSLAERLGMFAIKVAGGRRGFALGGAGWVGWGVRKGGWA